MGELGFCFSFINHASATEEEVHAYKIRSGKHRSVKFTNAVAVDRSKLHN